MESELPDEWVELKKKLREARASEVSFLGAIWRTLNTAQSRHDWHMVSNLMLVIDELANDLADIDREAS